MPSLIPSFETQRLYLRPHTKEDFPSLLSMWADPVVVRHITGQPSTAPQSWARLMNYLGHWSLMGFGYWAVEEKKSGSYIGEIGFADFKREIDPSLAGLPELGWVLASQAHGKGYATEATRAALAWGDQHLPGEKSICLVSPDNTLSIRVAEKIGFAETLRTVHKDLPTIVFSRTKPL